MGAYRPNAGCEPERDGGQRLARLGTVVRGRTPWEARPPEAGQVTGHWPVAAMPVGLPVTIVLHHLLPGSQELCGAPATICECGPGPPHGRRTEPKIGECGDDRAAALEQAPAEQRPQEVKEPQIGANGYMRDHMRQNVVNTVE